MLDRTESDNGAANKGGGWMKQRIPKASSFNNGGGSGYSTDESNEATDSKKRRAGKRPHNSGHDKLSDAGKASVIWMVLVIGLMFCLMDAMYISRVLDRGPTAEAELLTAEQILAELQRQGKPKAERFPVRELFRKDFFPHLPQSYGIKGHAERSLEQDALKQQQLQHQLIGKAKRFMTPEERAEWRRQQQEEKRLAEANRIKMIKMAALEALKAEHGGKIPDDMIDKVLEDEEAFKPRPMAYYKEQSIEDGKDRILNLFIDAGLKNMDDSTYKVLPKWSDVSKLYGDEPKIIGLEQCESFRKKGNPWDHFVSTAGTFNSGTNLMAEMLIHNCHMEERMKKYGHQNRGIRWQVPWGKHTPPGDEQYRLEHKSIKDKDVDANMILPAVTVRDPYYWMQSMCKHHYTASWRASDRCPNLTPSETDHASFPMLRGKDYFPVSVRYADFYRHHKSLTGMWGDWYNEYRGVEFQRLFVRYEDLLFHPKNVTETVCKCAGGTMNRGNFQYVVDSAKKGIGAHGSVRTGYVDAIIKYGSERNRYNGYRPEDLAYARENLDPILMEEFGYMYHPASLENMNDNQDEGEGDAGNEHEDEEEERAEHKEEDEAPEVPDDKEDEEEEGEEEEANEEGDAKEQGSDEEDPNDHEKAEKSADLGDNGDEESEAEEGVEEEETRDVEEDPEVLKSADAGDKEDIEEEVGNEEGEEEAGGGEEGDGVGKEENH